MTDGNESMNPYFFNGQDVNGESHIDCGRGLTKREYFAAMAMQGLANNFNIHSESEDCAVTAVRFADALIEALNK